MIVRESSLVIQNVICVEEVIPHDEWYVPALSLRMNLVNEDIYYTSPVIFTIEEMENEPSFGKYTYYIGLNGQVEVPEDAFYKQLDYMEIMPAIYVRCPEVDEIEDAYMLLRGYAVRNGLEIKEPFYHVCLDVFDDVMMDIYARVKEVPSDGR
ncbi:MAG: DUF5085 family protein [Weizmannia coagulans]|jgi:hypothetical protein|uniref:Uncharacterized protein n=2 Tax=Heyndrickxia TaxID=2837504 RepID=A0A133KD26_HEYCO|nr:MULTISPECIES: DUF5085 family protein [Heyndrickxia]KGT37384.1 hypothetical protein P421_15570 [Heyndrickxia coagulans P38]KWZ77374.1 hypothetical protein HMPREF3213_03280 [Heyndrickxia coagulans]MCI1575279.1 DUF5085 family protein [Heyndrickxia coagulans]MED4320936.1 DUF5085 family protein [Weizmannia sp. CD-2023]MED4841938.1 DUF5085 family protein [Weizmannia sp. CD-2023]